MAKDLSNGVKSGCNATIKYLYSSIFYEAGAYASAFFCPPLAIFLHGLAQASLFCAGIGPVAGVFAGTGKYISKKITEEDIIKELIVNRYKECDYNSLIKDNKEDDDFC